MRPREQFLQMRLLKSCPLCLPFSINNVWSLHLNLHKVLRYLKFILTDKYFSINSGNLNIMRNKLAKGSRKVLGISQEKLSGFCTK